MFKKHGSKGLAAFILALALSSFFASAVLAATVEDVENNSLRVGLDVYDLNGAHCYSYDHVLASLSRGGSHYFFKLDGRWYNLLDDNINSLLDLQDPAKAVPPAEVIIWRLTNWYVSEDAVQIFEDPVMVIGDETIDGEYVVNRDYTDNGMLAHDIGKVPVFYGNIDITDHLEFEYFTEENGEKITTFDFANGGTTLRVFVVAESEEYGSFSAYVIFKYRSVTVGKNDNYLTIEDALAQAKSGDTIYVKYNTSFADPEAAQHIYGTENFTVKKGVTVLLPYDGELKTGLNEGINSTTKINREQAYVSMTLPPGIELTVKGTLTVNALRGNASTRYMGFVHSSDYAKLQLGGEDSKIIVEEGGTLNAIGFICGDGFVEAKSGSKIVESIFVKQFRGGTDTTRMPQDAFPFDQFTAANIETDLVLKTGCSYSGSMMIYMNSGWWPSSLAIIDHGSSSLIQLTNGAARKSFNTANGQVTIELEGDASVNNATVNVGSHPVKTEGKAFPFDGTWHFVIKTGGKLTVNAQIALLPGATMMVEQGGEVVISEGGRATVFDPFEYVVEDSGFSAYPMPAGSYYRAAPSFGFTANTPAKLDVKGTLTAESGACIAGRVNLLEDGVFDKENDVIESYDFYYVTGSTKALVQKRTVHLLSPDAGDEIILVSNRYSGDEAYTMNLKAIVRDGEGNPLSGITVNFGGGTASQYQIASSITDENGVATSVYNAKKNEVGTLTATISGTSTKADLKFDYEGAYGCPLIYSFDGQEFHLEHEPVPTSANKAFEGTTYGTLRKLQEVDGWYLVRVGEDDLSETYVNGVNLYAVEYASGSDIREVFVDIYGTPHTIRGRAVPKSFVDSGGRDWLDSLLTEGKLVSAPGLSMLEQGQYVETYIATFDLPDDTFGIGKLIIKTQETNLTVDFVDWYHTLIDGCNNVWWIERALQTTDGLWNIIDAIGMLGLEVELWNGSEWVCQGTVTSGSHFFEGFLIPIDLGMLEEGTSEVKIRFKSGSGFVMFDQVSMDFSPDEITACYPLELQQALRNGQDDVATLVEYADDQRVKLQKGDYLDLFFLAPKPADGYERGFFTDFTGYYHWGLESKTDPVVDTWSDFTYGAIIESVLTVQPEAAGTVEILEWLFDLTETTLGQSMEYKIENIYVEHALPWMKENLWQQVD